MSQIFVAAYHCSKLLGLISICWEQDTTLPSALDRHSPPTPKRPLPGSIHNLAAAAHLQIRHKAAATSGSPTIVPDSAATGGLSSPCPLPAVAASSHKVKYSKAAVAAGGQQGSGAPAVSFFARPFKAPAKSNSSSVFLQRCQGSRKRPRLDPQASAAQSANPSHKQAQVGAAEECALSEPIADAALERHKALQQLPGLLTSSNQEASPKLSLHSHPLSSMVVDNTPSDSMSRSQENASLGDTLMDEAPDHASASALPNAPSMDMVPGHLAQPSDFKTTAQDPAQPKKDIWLPLVLTGMPAQTVTRRSHGNALPAAPMTKTASHGRCTRHQAQAQKVSMPAGSSPTGRASSPAQAGVHRTPGRRKLHAQNAGGPSANKQTSSGTFERQSVSHCHPAAESNGRPPAGRTDTNSVEHFHGQPRSSKTTAQQQVHDAGAPGLESFNHTGPAKKGVQDMCGRKSKPQMVQQTHWRTTRLIDQTASSAQSMIQPNLPSTPMHQQETVPDSEAGSERASSPFQPVASSSAAAAKKRKSGRQGAAENQGKPWWMV